MYTTAATFPHLNLEILAGAIDRDPNQGLLWQPITMEHLKDFELADDVSLLARDGQK